MTQTLLVVILFVAAMATLPWLVRRLQQRHASGGPGGVGLGSRVLSAVAVGPQQRVVTVEVGPEHARTWLVLGVTAQQVSCLHVMPAVPNAGTAVSASPVDGETASFARAMATAGQGPEAQRHG